MGSLGFPFSFSQPSNHSHRITRGGASRPIGITLAVAAAAAAAAGVSTYQNLEHPLLKNALRSLLSNRPSSHLWGSISLADNSTDNVVDSKTGVSFPSVIGDSRKLLGIGLRQKSVFGLKKIDVYAFGNRFWINAHSY